MMSADSDVERLVREAEAEWLERWAAGPTETGSVLQVGAAAPDAVLADDAGVDRRLSELWSDGPVLLMFWRHFGCGCGVMRSERLRNEWSAYVGAGLRPVIVGQGEPERATAYKDEHGLEAMILCDPDHDVYRDYGLGHWEFQKIMLSEPPAEYLADPVGWAAEIQRQRRDSGRPIVDDPWRATAEFVIGTDGRILHAHYYEHCYDAPDPDTLIAAVTSG